MTRPARKPIVERRVRLRWAFYYHNGRAPRRGAWDGNSGRSMAEMAAFQPKDGLLWAVIEAESLEDYSIRRLVEVPGPDLVTIQIDAFARGPGISWNGAAVTPASYLSGMSIVTRTERISAKIDGSVTRQKIVAGQRFDDVLEHQAGSGR